MKNANPENELPTQARVFGVLTMVGNPFKENGRILSVFKCKCGVKKRFYLYNVTSGKSKSCGCEMGSKVAAARTIHGDNKRGHRTTEYTTWRHIKSRCLNPKIKCFKYYGGRGIRICRRWMRFENFLADMGRKPSPELSIERKNNNGNYTPKNCKWATRSEQNKNRRPFKKYGKITSKS